MDFDYLFKCDNDTYFNSSNLLKGCRNFIGDLGGNLVGWQGVDRQYHFGKCKDQELNKTKYQGEHKGPWPNGGCGYILSRKAAEIVGKPENEPFFDKELYEDKAVADLLRDHGITPAQVPKIDGKNPPHVNISSTTWTLQALHEKIRTNRDVFLVFGTARSGTTLLAEGIDEHPNIKCHGELLHPRFNRKNGTKYLRRVLKPLPGMAIGCKLTYGQANNTNAWDFINSPDIALICTLRHPFASYVSVIQSNIDNQWNSKNPAEKNFQVDIELEKWDDWFEKWKTYVSKIPKRAMIVYYHELATTFQPTMCKVFNRLRQSPEVVNPPLAKLRSWQVFDRVKNVNEVMEWLEDKKYKLTIPLI